MGLSGRKVKQKISTDPRNLEWADDAAKFGQAYLSKLGWNPAQGLGASGEGRTSHVKVSHKLDGLGIGAQHTRDPDGLAWKQNKDFEAVLKRLNASMVLEKGEGEVEVEGKGLDELKGNAKDEVEKVDRDSKDLEKMEKRRRKEEKKRKRKEKESAEATDDETRKRKSLKFKTSEDEEGGSSSAPPPPIATTVTETEVLTESSMMGSSKATTKVVSQRHRAHRKRVMAAKDLSSKSALSISEILGVSTSNSASTSAPSTPTHVADGEPALTLSQVSGLEVLTTSTQSVGDYFKALMKAKTKRYFAADDNLPNGNNDSRTEQTIQSRYDEEDEGRERPRGGIGSSRSRLLASITTEPKDSPSSLTPPKCGSSFTTSINTLLPFPNIQTETSALEPLVSDVTKKEMKKRKKSCNEEDGKGNAKDDAEERATAKAERRRLKKLTKAGATAAAIPQ